MADYLGTRDGTVMYADGEKRLRQADATKTREEREALLRDSDGAHHVYLDSQGSICVFRSLEGYEGAKAHDDANLWPGDLVVKGRIK